MKTCKHCSENFQETKDRQIYCSHTCQAREAIKRANLFKKPKPRKGVTLNCIVCNKEFYVAQYRIKTGKTKYCSRSCLAKIELPKYAHCGFRYTGLPHHTYKHIKVNGKRIREHRYIMQQHLGRNLEKWEHVHHINNDPSDNRLDNLVILSNSDHQKEEWKFKKKLKSIS